MTTQLNILKGYNLPRLKEFKDNSFDSLVTDPPYGLGIPPNPVEVLTDWLAKDFHEIKNGKGFMSKEWDAFVPQPLLWKEVLRVLKPGAHGLVACSTRTADWMGMSLRLAGFEIRDTIPYIFGSGFPKSMSIGKAIDLTLGADRKVVSIKENRSGRMHHVNKFNHKQSYRPNAYNEKGNVFKETEAATDQAKEFDGFGTALKPSTELWILVRKPISEKTIAQNVLKWGTGGLNIDGCRIGWDRESLTLDTKRRQTPRTDRTNNSFHAQSGTDKTSKYVGENFSPPGRWPANLLLSHHDDCVCTGTKKVKAITGGSGEKSTGNLGGHSQRGRASHPGANAGGLGDENGLETIEAWDCHPDCPVRIMDEQSGEAGAFAQVSSGMPGESRGIYGDFADKGDDGASFRGDKGGASRFFYCAKPSTSERNTGLENFFWKRDGKKMVRISQAEYITLPEKDRFRGNIHPTVKPVSLMCWLVRLITPPSGHVLDPYSGTGTTGIGCKIEEFSFTGIEEDPDSCDMSVARINGYVVQPKNLIPSLFDSLPT